MKSAREGQGGARGALVWGAALAAALAVAGSSAADDLSGGAPAAPAAAGPPPPSAQEAPVDSASAAAAAISTLAWLRAAYAGPLSSWPAPQVDEGVAWVELGPAPPAVVASGDSPARRALGQTLFFDPRLSRSGQIACASCHEPDLAWADGRTVSFGHGRKPLTRNTPALLFAGNRASLFWDGRAASLEDQALQVMSNPDEMHESAAAAAAVVSSIPGYAPHFEAAFGDATVTAERLAQALAAYERTLVGGRSAFDRFARGQTDALSDAGLRGLHVFRTRARCMNCHHGPLFTDDDFHDLGLSYYGRKLEDLGRLAVTGEVGDVGKFRTPTLRDVARTAPYMHVGLFPLRGVLNLYRAGMPTLRRKPGQERDVLFPTKSPLLHRLDLSVADLADLEAFLESLTEPRRRVRPPPLPQ